MVREPHAQACGGWNKAVKTSTRSWEDGEDPGRAHHSCGGTKVYKSGLEKSKAENHHKAGNGVTARGGTRPKGAE